MCFLDGAAQHDICSRIRSQTNCWPTTSSDTEPLHKNGQYVQLNMLQVAHLSRPPNFPAAYVLRS